MFLGIIAASTFGILSLSVLLYLLLCTQQIRKKAANNTKSHNFYYSPGAQKSVKLSVQCDTAKRYVNPPIPFTFQNRYDSAFVENHKNISSSLTTTSSDSSEYAEPDCENLDEPLIKMCSNDRSTFCTNSESIHYASSPIVGKFDKDSTSQPLSSFERFSRMEHKLLCDMPIVEFNSSALHVVEKTGSGKFGDLQICTMSARNVLVKYAKQDERSLKGFKCETQVMSQFGHHNVCAFYGIINNNGLLGSILEFPSNGDLPNYMRRQNEISQEQLLSICTEIAAGMAYFESLGFVHRDLSARNCLVDFDRTVKISDIAILNPVYVQDYYQLPNSNSILPIRWMACESLETGDFSSFSDSWSLAVTIWEVFGLCKERPYQLDDLEVIKNLEQMNETGQLTNYLECPKNCPLEIYDQILLKCWIKEPSQRPSNAQIHRKLQAMHY